MCFGLAFYLIEENTPKTVAYGPSDGWLEEHSLLVIWIPFSAALEVAEHSMTFAMKKTVWVAAIEKL